LTTSSKWSRIHRHHANPNHIDKDPDVAADILVFTGGQATLRTGFRRRLTRHQAWLFFPLTLLEGIALKIQGFRDLRRQAPGERAVEGALLVSHVAAYATLLLTFMSPGKALAFAAIHQALFGLHLGMAFAPNHKGMEMPDPDGEPWGHLRRQVLTSRNIRGDTFTDWFLGGQLPDCRDLGIPYTETGLVDSYRQALDHMHEVGEPLRADR
jgi:fatty acid desaturase